MKQHQYGSYAEYVAAQVEANVRKTANVWVRPETVALIAANAPPEVGMILCHGTRNGAEQKLFKKHYPRAFVLGTELAPSAERFEYTVQWDFHHPNEAWLAACDMVYSNSWDHAFDPRLALQRWREQLSKQGRLYLEIGTGPTVNRSSATDPLEISHDEVLGMLEQAGLRLRALFSTHGCKGGPEHESVLYMAERA